MSKSKVLFVLLAVAGICLITISCGGGGGGKIQQRTVTSIAVALGAPSIQVGATTSCTPTVTYSDGSSDHNAACASDNTSVASVANNVVTGVSAGTANITASAGGVTSPKVQITVTAATKTVTSIAVALGAPSIQVGATTSCTPTVTYSDGSSDHNAACASDNTSVASVANNVVTGVSAGTANITASAGGVTSPKVQITVTAVQQQAVISSATPPMFVCNDEHLGCVTPTVKLYGSNFTSACTVTISPAANGLSYSTYRSPTEIDLHLQFDTPSYNPGQFVIQACTQSPQTISSPFTIGFMANRNELAVDPGTGDVFVNDPFALIVHHYNAKGVLLETFAGDGRAMAADDTTQELIFVSYLAKGIASEAEYGNCRGSGYRGCGAGNYDGFMLGVSAKSGYTCAFEPAPTNRTLCFDLVNDPEFQNPFSYTLLQDPCATAMVPNGSEVDLLVWNCGDNTISRISVPDMTLKGAIVLNEITPATAGFTFVEVAALSSGTVAVMSPIDAKLFLVDLSSMTEIGNPVSFDGYPDGITSNEAANAFEVTFASSPQAVPTGAELVSPTGTITKLGLSSPNLPLGIAVSPDGTTLYVGDRGGVLDVENNQ